MLLKPLPPESLGLVPESEEVLAGGLPEESREVLVGGAQCLPVSVSEGVALGLSPTLGLAVRSDGVCQEEQEESATHLLKIVYH